MSVFRFKHFEVRNELAAQKVGTDAVLLGAALTLPDEPQQHLLDIGTGTGVIALMVAQRLADRIKSQGMSAEAPGKPSGTQPHFKILAIDIDPAAASEATANFAASPWAPSLHAKALSLNDLERHLDSLDMAAESCERRECRLADAPGGQRPFPACTDETNPFAGDTKVEESCEGRECRLTDAPGGQRPFPACPDETNPFAGDTKVAESCERRECRLADAPGGQRPFPACPDETNPFAAIFSNPPYFEASLKAPDARRSTARHTDTLSYREICAFAASHLTPDGILSLILPASEEQPLLRYAASFGLRPFRILRIRTTARKPASRIIAEFRRAKTTITPNNNTLPAEELILMSGTDRSPAYAALTKDFYL